MQSVLFDLEGTLVETIYQTSQKAAENLHIQLKEFIINHGIPEEILRNFNRMATIRNKAYFWAKKNYEKNAFDQFNNEVNVFLKKFDMKSAKRAELYPETLYVLEKLKQNQIEMGIVTNTSTEAANYIMSKLKLKKYFNPIITRNDVFLIKPEPEMIFLASSKLSTIPSYLIGDSTLDLLAAQTTNINTIIIRRKKPLLKIKPTYFIETLDEILKILI